MILVAVGANLPGRNGEAPVETCRAAVARMAALPGLRLQAASRWYRSRPVPRSDQPDYVNGVVRLSGEVEPASLLAGLQAIEQAAGRQRGAANAARTLDLDIIDIDGAVRDSPDPVLPHPRAAIRAFVLLPLIEVAPGWVEPRRGRRAADLLTALLAPSEDGCGATALPLDWPIPY